MCEDHTTNGVVRPLVLTRLVDVFKPSPARRPAVVVALPVAVGALGDLAAGVHCDGRVAAADPEFHPVGERRPAAAVDEDHGGDLPAGFDLGTAVPGKDAGGFAAVGDAVEEERTDAVVAVEAGGGVGLGSAEPSRVNL